MVLCPAVTAAWRSMGVNENTIRAVAFSACPLGAAGLMAAIQASAICSEDRGRQFPFLWLWELTQIYLCSRVTQQPGSPFTSRCCKVRLVFAEISITYVMLQQLMEAFSGFGRDHCDTLWDICHIEVVLLSRPFWMLIQQLTTMEHFCVTCWMNLHVNCRPIALPLKFLEVLHN